MNCDSSEMYYVVGIKFFGTKMTTVTAFKKGRFVLHREFRAVWPNTACFCVAK